MMKNHLRYSIIATILLIGTTAIAQNFKFGHINSQELLSLMPERDSAQAILEEYAGQLEGQLEAMQVEYNNKVQVYLAEQESYTELIRSTKEQELADINERMQGFQATAQQDLRQKEAELIQPIITKAQNAVKEVGKENGFTYVFDIATGS
ncbi:MAG: OmpH family outer membrane protein, partial [Bacteroidales bacterium]